MTQVIANMSMSLDGIVSHPVSGVEHLFGWYFSGEVEVETASSDLTFQMGEEDAERMQQAPSSLGALVAGRRTFDEAQGWNGHHPMGCPVFVVTHQVPEGWPREDSDITFVTDGVDSAVARAKAVAGDRIVAIASPDIVRQCLDADLLDEIRVDLIPVLLNEGTRFFDNLANSPIWLQDPEISAGKGVTHLHYRVASH